MTLDEPTSGLDPISRQDFYAQADEVAQQGTAVLQSSHSLTELEARTDRIAILKQGKLVANASLEVLQMSAALPTELVVTPTPGKLGDLLQRIPTGVVNADNLLMTCQPSEKVDVLRRLWALNDLVADIQVKAPRLDDVYRFYSAANITEQRSKATNAGAISSADINNQVCGRTSLASSDTDIPVPGVAAGEPGRYGCTRGNSFRNVRSC